MLGGIFLGFAGVGVTWRARRRRSLTAAALRGGKNEGDWRVLFSLVSLG